MLKCLLLRKDVPVFRFCNLIYNRMCAWSQIVKSSVNQPDNTRLDLRVCLGFAIELFTMLYWKHVHWGQTTFVWYTWETARWKITKFQTPNVLLQVSEHQQQCKSAAEREIKQILISSSRHSHDIVAYQKTVSEVDSESGSRQNTILGLTHLQKINVELVKTHKSVPP